MQNIIQTHLGALRNPKLPKYRFRKVLTKVGFLLELFRLPQIRLALKNRYMHFKIVIFAEFVRSMCSDVGM